MISRNGLFGVWMIAGLLAGAPVLANDGLWTPAIWNGERAMTSEQGGNRAIVALERGRLVHFGPTDDDINLLFSASAREDPMGWGGHRVWLGPQYEWPVIWPPPVAWEKSGAESHSASGAALKLVMYSTGDEWPRIVRRYSWVGGALHCDVALEGGTHAAQIVQIVTVSSAAVVRAHGAPADGVPLGFVRVPIGVDKPVVRNLPWPNEVERVAGDALLLRPAQVVGKLGFFPQTLFARIGSYELEVARGNERGEIVGTPDEAFYTQVYLGARDLPLLELEQFSPRFAAGSNVGAAIVLRARRVTEK